jgi:hypothetical protein
MTRISTIHREGDWLFFDYAGKEPVACKPVNADVTNWARMKVMQGCVIRNRAGQVASC